MATTQNRFGTAPVFFTTISTILGAILFLRFGWALGTLGFWGIILVIVVGHLVTIPAAFAISEIATNQRVEGGGAYYIISRSFGLNIGGTIGIALYFSQAISVAFYVIAFTESFGFLFDYLMIEHGITLPKQAVSIPLMGLLALLILRKGANLGINALYVVAGILLFSLLMFFVGKGGSPDMEPVNLMKGQFRNMDDFYKVFAIIFPAFTGLMAGVGLSGDLKNPGKSIPLGTLTATFAGLAFYIFVVLKLVYSASPDDLTNNYLIMEDIGAWGKIIIPIGLAASTLSSALGSIMVAPRTLQALGVDNSLPATNVNQWVASSKNKEPFNASLITVLIAFIFVAIGELDQVATIITMFFMLTYCAVSLISFLNHFGSSPSYRPGFRSHWALSLVGFIASIYLMIKIDPVISTVSITIIVALYFIITAYHKERRGLESIFRSVLFQVNRKLQVYLQKPRLEESAKEDTWHPSVVCVTDYESERDNALRLLSWMSHKYGFGTYIKYIQGYYSKAMREKSTEAMKDLLTAVENHKSKVYVDTIVSPSYTSAIAQIIQLPGISGMDNNLILFEFDKKDPLNLAQIVENFALVRSGSMDVAILGASNRGVNYKEGIHIWVQSLDWMNLNLMIFISYIILGHPDWEQGRIKIFSVAPENSGSDTDIQLDELVKIGRLPISQRNIQFLTTNSENSLKTLINKYSSKAGLTMVGFHSDQLKHKGGEIFNDYEGVGDILFVNAHNKIKIN